MTALQTEKEKFDFILMCQLCEIEFAIRNEAASENCFMRLCAP